jgi:hypothetical protein
MLRLSGHAEVLGPPDVRERLIASALSVLARYGAPLPLPDAAPAVAVEPVGAETASARALPVGVAGPG